MDNPDIPVSPTIPIVPPNLPVVPSISPVASRSAQTVDVRERIPVLVDLKDMRWMKPSLRESFIADQWLVSFNYVKCAKAYEVKFGKPLSSVAVKRWIGRSRVAEYIRYKLEAQGVYNRYKGEDGKKLWLKELLEYREGIRECGKKELAIMEMIGRYLGYAESNESSGGFNMKAQVINFVQQNGNP